MPAPVDDAPLEDRDYGWSLTSSTMQMPSRHPVNISCKHLKEGWCWEWGGGGGGNLPQDARLRGDNQRENTLQAAISSI